MTDKIINGIDVSECPCKDDDKCLEVPILNEYGDLIDYQDCEPQTLCPYRSKTKIQRLQEENEELKQENKRLNEEMWGLYSSTVLNLCCCSDINEYKMLKTNMRKDVVLYNKFSKYRQALEEIRNEIGDLKDINKLINLQKILDKINEALNDGD